MPAGGAAAPVPPAHLQPLRQIHRGLSRDARRLHGAAQLVPAEMGRIIGWWTRVRGVLVWHLDTKEQLLFPQLSRLSEEWARHSPALLNSHDALRAAARSVSQAGPGGLWARWDWATRSTTSARPPPDSRS